MQSNPDPNRVLMTIVLVTLPLVAVIVALVLWLVPPATILQVTPAVGDASTANEIELPIEAPPVEVEATGEVDEPPADNEAEAVPTPPPDAVPVVPVEEPPIAQPQIGVGRDERPVKEGWWLGSIQSSASEFAFTRSAASTGERYDHAAPIGRRFLTLNLQARWDGRQTGELLVSAGGSNAPTILLQSSAGDHLPLGAVLDDAVPWDYLLTTPIRFADGEAKNISLLFEVPEEITDFAIMVDREERGRAIVPAPVAVGTVRLTGQWRKSRRLLGPLRYNHPVLDALVSLDANLLACRRQPDGTLAFECPAAGATGQQVSAVPEETTMRVQFTKRQRAANAVLRPIRGGRSLLLYLTPDSGQPIEAVFLFDRIE